MYRKKSTLRVGTDCSGIEAPIQALKQLGIQFRHLFSSEIDRSCIKMIKANYHPERIYGDPDGEFPEGDITKRDVSKLPNVDLYICGFPCQSFSFSGLRRPLHEDRRGIVFWSCVDVIRAKKPKYFILENVLGLLSHNEGKTWRGVLSELESLSKDIGYTIKYDTLNPKDYGIPQNRPRIFIVGKRGKKKQFVFPPPHLPLKPLRSFVDDSDSESTTLTISQKDFLMRSKKALKEGDQLIFLNLSRYEKPASKNSKLVSCLLTRNDHLCVPYMRKMNIRERFALQGFDEMDIVVGKTAIYNQTGNTMNVNVLKEIIRVVLD